MKSDIEYFDLAENIIKVGFFVAYAASLGRCPILKYGIVTRLESRTDKWQDNKEIPTLRVITVEKQDIWKANKIVKRDWTLQKKGSEIALGFLDRLLVVDRVPPTVKAVLTEALKKFNASK